MRNLVERLHLRLTPGEQEWFQGGWKLFDGASTSYNQAFDLNEIAQHGKHVWGGQMLPDMVPLLGNGAGDCLGARIKGDGSISEFVEWRHEGGGWRHLGYSFQQALSLNQLGIDPSERETEHSSHFQLSPVVICEASCERALRSRLHEACAARGSQRVAELIGVNSKLFRTWLFDTALIPTKEIRLLEEFFGIEADKLIFQDWATAAEQAWSVLNLRDDLAWPYVVIGWAHERKGEMSVAKDAYRRGLMKLGSSATFTANWTLADSTRVSKFAAERLISLGGSDLDAQAQDYVNALHDRIRAREYWINQAKQASDRGDHAVAYQYFYAAGWDHFCSNDMRIILSSMITEAEKGGLISLAALALLHRDSMDSRQVGRE